MSLRTGGGLINVVIIKLRATWVYKWGAYTQGGLYTGFYGIHQIISQSTLQCQINVVSTLWINVEITLIRR